MTPTRASLPSVDEELLSGLAALPLTEAQRIERIDAEMAGGFEALSGIGPAVSFFGSSRTPRTHPDYHLSRTVAAAVGSAGFAVITGGGPGLMEAANRGARDAGALSVGLKIALPHEQRPNRWLDVGVLFDHFFVRKLMFVRYASAFVALPGGFGTLDELFEALTLVETGKIRHFPVVLVGSTFWAGLADWVRGRLIPEGMVATSSMGLLHVLDDPAEIAGVVTHHHRRQMRSAAARFGTTHPVDAPRG